MHQRFLLVGILCLLEFSDAWRVNLWVEHQNRKIFIMVFSRNLTPLSHNSNQCNIFWKQCFHHYFQTFIDFFQNAVLILYIFPGLAFQRWDKTHGQLSAGKRIHSPTLYLPYSTHELGDEKLSPNTERSHQTRNPQRSQEPPRFVLYVQVAYFPDTWGSIFTSEGFLDARSWEIG